MGATVGQKIALCKAMGGRVVLDNAKILKSLFVIREAFRAVTNGDDPTESAKALAKLAAVDKVIDLFDVFG